MTWKWAEFWPRSRKWFKTGWLIAAGLIAVYVGAIAPLNGARELADEKQTGLDETWRPIPLWRESPASTASRKLVGFVGGVPGGVSSRAEGGLRMQASLITSAAAPPPAEDRKLVRTASLDLIVKNPAGAADQIRQLAERVGGYLENSQVSGAENAASAALTIRVPVGKFEEVRAEIRKLGIRVENDRLDAQDVTKDYVDREARLRNLHAQEQQYLAILKRAATVKDTLEVSEHLNDVRGEIEQQQAEFNALAKQVETVAVTVSLTAEADAQVFGLQWRPLYRLKIAAREGLDSLGDYVSTMTSLAFHLPTILLWLATILIGAAIGWRILRWTARVLFMSRKPLLAERGNN